MCVYIYIYMNRAIFRVVAGGVGPDGEPLPIRVKKLIVIVIVILIVIVIVIVIVVC